jgi:hypothetical protein
MKNLRSADQAEGQRSSFDYACRANWEKLDQLTNREQYRLLLQLTQKISPKKMDELCRRQKLLSIDSAMWSEAYWFRQLCNRAVGA